MTITIPITSWFIYGWLAVGMAFAIYMLVWAFVADTYGTYQERFFTFVSGVRWWALPLLIIGGPLMLAVFGVLQVCQTIARRRALRRWAAEDAEQERLAKLEAAENHQ